MAKAEENVYTLASLREHLIRQEDTIIYGLIERAKFPSNSNTYDDKYAQIPGFSGSLVEFVVKNAEDVQAKVLFTAIALSLLRTPKFSDKTFLSSMLFQDEGHL